MLNYHHEPTNTRIETDTGTLPNGGRSFESIDIQSGIVGVHHTVYEETETLPSFGVENVHICTGGVSDPDRMRVHVAEAIAAALAAEAVAS